jgi:type III secretion protein U
VRSADKPSFDLRRALTGIVTQAALLTLLPVVAATVTATAAVASQVGFQVSFKPLEPKFSAINPGSGLKRMFSMRSLVDLAKMLVKAAIIGAALWKMLLTLAPLIVGVAYEPVPDLIEISWSALCRLFAVGGVLYLVLGVADYAVQQWLFIRDHRMSKDDVKREHKDAEGDPHLKGKRKQVAREIVESNPEKNVAGAQAVIVNPTHYAVAVRYMPDEFDLPRVVAKGVDADALEIRRMAMRPEACFKAVAAVLAWVEDLAAQDAQKEPAGLLAGTSAIPDRGLPS